MLPEAVVSSEGAASPVRERLLQAMATCVMERGYRETTVADVVRVARTSRRSFYQEFADKQACFVDLLRTTNDAMIQAISEDVDPAAEWTMQIRQAVEAYVSVTEQNPAIAWSWIRELPALGDSARRVQVVCGEQIGMGAQNLALGIYNRDKEQRLIPFGEVEGDPHTGEVLVG